MVDFIVKKRICSDFEFHKPYLPAVSCGSCCTYVSRFWRDGTSVKTHSSPDNYLTIAEELRNLPMETRNPVSKLECSCQICQIARSKSPSAKKAKILK